MTSFVKKSEKSDMKPDCLLCEDFMDDADISITKVVSSKPKKSMQWVSSSFGDFDDCMVASQHSKRYCQSQATPSQSRKRSREAFHTQEAAHRLTTSVKGREGRLKAVLSTDLWSDKYEPKNKGELAVHKKKVEEIEGWLRDRSSNIHKHSAPILLLTGPAGAGKTAAICCVVREQKFELQEWSNPIQLGQPSEQLIPETYNPYDQSRVDVKYSESQLTQFQNFLLRANKYNSLGQLFGAELSTQKIILIEELPNIFFRDNAAFHDILRKYHLVGRCPLVFVISDTTSGDSNERLLFPRALQDELRIDNISFNPVAPTMMIKILTRIASVESSQVSSCVMPSSSVIESIAMSSAGDVRSAINALQFACRQDTFDLRKKSAVSKAALKKSGSGSGSGRRLKYQTSTKQEKGSGAESAIGARDTSCFLFHAIGKILYCKRSDPSMHSDAPRLPQHLAQHDRDPLLIDPEDVVEKSHLSGDYFTSFLHQNYLDFYAEIEDVVRASEYISDADFFTAKWDSRSVMQNYAVSIASRGILHSNSVSARFNAQRVGPGWKPIHKSQWFSIQKQTQQNCRAAHDLFKGYHWDPEVLCCEIVPFINIISITLHSPGQISFVQEMSHFLSVGNSSRSSLEKLDEKDVITLDGDDSQMPQSTQATYSGEATPCEELLTSSQNEIKTAKKDEEEEEIIIEDFDD